MISIQFFGHKISPGEKFFLPVGVDGTKLIQISQVTLGLDAKIGERVFLTVDVKDKGPIVVGSLEAGRVDCLTLSLVFDEAHSLAHSATSDVYIAGQAFKETAPSKARTAAQHRLTKNEQLVSKSPKLPILGKEDKDRQRRTKKRERERGRERKNLEFFPVYNK